MKKKKILLWSTVSFLVIAIVTVGLCFWTKQQIDNYAKAPLNLTTAQEFQVSPGMTVTQLVAELAKDGLLEDDWHFKAMLKLDPLLAKIRAGLYEIEPGMSLSALLKNITHGKVKHFSITLVEGQTIAQWKQQLSKQQYLSTEQDPFTLVLSQAKDKRHPEGLFFPDTYHYIAGQDPVDFLSKSYQKMQHELADAWTARDQSIPLKNPYELLVLASIVEKETAKPSERPWVAAVFMNRLRKGMRLQTDPTVIYGMGERYKGNITRKDLREKTAYNTYRIRGLPPTPIAAPSRASLQAAANPANVSYLYFVSRNDGSHVFSNTLKEHNRAVDKYQRNR